MSVGDYKGNVVIEVERGTLSVRKRPEGIVVIVLDYDTEGADESRLCRCKVGNGRPHYHSVTRS